MDRLLHLLMAVALALFTAFCGLLIATAIILLLGDYGIVGFIGLVVFVGVTRVYYIKLRGLS